MLKTSSQFDAAVTADVREIQARFLLAGQSVEGNIKQIVVNQGTGCDSEFTIGTLYSSYITARIEDCPTRLENQTITLQIGAVLPDKTTEWVSVGVYTVGAPDTDAYGTEITAYGCLSTKFGGVYNANKAEPISTTLSNLTKQTGCTIDVSAFSSAALGLKPAQPFQGLQQREVLMYIASLLGGFATETVDGNVVIRKYSVEPTAFVDADRTTELYTFNDLDYLVTGVSVIVSEDTQDDDGNTVTGVSYSYETPNLVVTNPYMTKALFDYMAPVVTGLRFRPATLPITMGDIRWEPGDVLSVTDVAGATYIVPCMGLVHTYEGGLDTTVTASGRSTTEQESRFSGSLSARVQRTETELLIAAAAILKKASIEQLEVLRAKIEQLDVEQAIIESAKIQKLSAAVANIETLLAGSAGVGDLQAVHLTSDNVVIDDAIITDAMIADLSASKILSGTIYTNLVNIMSQDGNLSIVDNTILVKDGAGTPRIQIGKDGNGDYNYYLWDAAGNLMWDAGGVTESGLNDGIIRDANVADDAAIQGSKLDIQSVVEQINADGSTTINAGKVKIDDTTLDAAYQSLTKTVTETQSKAVTSTTSEFYLSTSPTAQTGGSWSTERPEWTDGTYLWTRSIVTYGDGTSKTTAAVCITGNTGEKGDTGATGTGVFAVTQYYAVGTSTSINPSAPSAAAWSTTMPVVAANQYLWSAFLVTYTDGSTSWTEPMCLTDPVVREHTKALETDLKVTKEAVESKAWMSDIETITDPMGEQISNLQDSYTQVTQNYNGITTEIANLKTTVGKKADGSTVETLKTRIATVEQTASEFEQKYKATDSNVADLKTRMSTAESSISQNAKNIALKVSADGIISAINQSAEKVSISASKIDLSGYVTITNLANEGSTKINGSNITTGSLRGVSAVWVTGSDYGASDSRRYDITNSSNVRKNEYTYIRVTGSALYGRATSTGALYAGKSYYRNSTTKITTGSGKYRIFDMVKVSGGALNLYQQWVPQSSSASAVTTSVMVSISAQNGITFRPKVGRYNGYMLLSVAGLTTAQGFSVGLDTKGNLCVKDCYINNLYAKYDIDCRKITTSGAVTIRGALTVKKPTNLMNTYSFDNVGVREGAPIFMIVNANGKVSSGRPDTKWVKYTLNGSNKTAQAMTGKVPLCVGIKKSGSKYVAKMKNFYFVNGVLVANSAYQSVTADNGTKSW